MRRAWFSLGLVVLVGAAVPLACGQKFELTGSAGMGGSGATGTSASGDVSVSAGGGDVPTSSTTTTGSGGCMTTADCTAPATVCGEPFCINGHCGTKKNQEDGSTKSQVYGDCHELKCKNGLLVDEENNNDVYDDANACTDDTCDNGVPKNLPRPSGDKCSMDTRVCDGQGACVECVSNTDCVDPDACRNNYCVPEGCYDMMLTVSVGETDNDCGGGTCQPCGENKHCFFDTDCVSGVCVKPAGTSVLRCLSSCTDQVKNGTETDNDCGGSDCVNRCAAGDACNVPGDCKSGVCISGKCIPPSCSDGVKNGNESGVDCGTGCGACLGG